MFNIVVSDPNPQSAWFSFSNNIRKLDWYHNQGYHGMCDFFEKSTHPFILEIIRDKSLSADAMHAKYFERFKTELYDAAKVQSAVDAVRARLPDVQTAYPGFKKMHDAWGFKLPDQYTISCSVYTPGGQYSGEKNWITLGMPNLEHMDWRVGTLIHEMVHIGVEESIVQAFNLPHGEKERLVDNLCLYVAPDIFTNRCRLPDGTRSSYQPMFDAFSYMDAVVGKQPETDLIAAVRRFVSSGSSHPRQVASSIIPSAGAARAEGSHKTIPEKS